MGNVHEKEENYDLLTNVLEFASWIDSAFKLYLIKEFERLKQNESYQSKIDWSVRRELAKTNYKIHTDSIKQNIIPTLTEKQKLNEIAKKQYSILQDSEGIRNIEALEENNFKVL